MRASLFVCNATERSRNSRAVTYRIAASVTAALTD